MILSRIVYLSVEEAQHAWEIHIGVELYTRASAGKETHMLFIPVGRYPLFAALTYAVLKSKWESVRIKIDSKGGFTNFRPRAWMMRRTRKIRRLLRVSFKQSK